MERGWIGWNSPALRRATKTYGEKQDRGDGIPNSAKAVKVEVE